jgi:hypothetical protein
MVMAMQPILAGIFAGYRSVNSWSGRTDLLQELLHIGFDYAVQVELRWHHIAIEKSHGKQIRQAVIRLLLGLDDLVYGSILFCLVSSTMQ